MLLPESNPKCIEAIAERIRISVREHVFLYRNHAYGPITVSIGAVCYPDQGEAADILLKNADDALYNAKQSGRDQVIVASLPD